MYLNATYATKYIEFIFLQETTKTWTLLSIGILIEPTDLENYD